MKKCPKCGMNFGDDKLLCPNCGSTPETVNTENSFFNAASKDEQKRKVEWYESIWFIVICFITGFWPLGIGMILLRVYRNGIYNSMDEMKLSGDWNSNGAAEGEDPEIIRDAVYRKAPKSRRVKTKGVGKLIAGTIMISLGVIFFGYSPLDTPFDIQSTVATAGVFVGIGLVLIAVFAADNRDWHKYEALIDNRGNTRISFVASRLGIRQSKARTKLQKMINKGFLSEPENDIAAYINGEYDLVVMTRGGKPIVPVEETVAEDIAEREAKARAAEDRARRAGAVEIEDRFLIAIEDAVSFTKDVDVIGCLKRMEKSVRSIQAQLKNEPSKAEMKSVDNMKTSYIPSTIDLIEKYMRPETTEESRAQIKGMFSTLASAFANLDKKLRKQDDIEMEAEIEVMKQTLARDGLLDSDFDL